MKSSSLLLKRLGDMSCFLQLGSRIYCIVDMVSPNRARYLGLLKSLTFGQTLKQQMNFLHRALAYPPFRRIWRAAFEYLQDLLWKDVLLRQDFTTLGAARFRQDLLAIQSVVNSVASETGTAFGMPRLNEGVALLNLRLEIDEGHDPQLSLGDASHKIFAGNAEAEEVLQNLGMTHLSRNDARSILQRRVEAND